MYTINQFVYDLWDMGAVLGLHSAYLDDSFLSTEDLYNTSESVLTRIHAARIIHQYLIHILKEKDIDDWSYASRMLDLYDCHTCVNHIAQIISKGIMEPIKQENILVFHGNLPVGKPTSSVYIKRIFSCADRLAVPSIDRKNSPAESISLAEYSDRLSQREFEKIQLIDVRSKEHYETNHLPNALHIPLADILENKYIDRLSTGSLLIVYCDKGYLSQIAADYLKEQGFLHVFYMAL